VHQTKELWDIQVADYQTNRLGAILWCIKYRKNSRNCLHFM